LLTCCSENSTASRTTACRGEGIRRLLGDYARALRSRLPGTLMKLPTWRRFQPSLAMFSVKNC
jgi:hypothetical protein